MRQGTLHYSKQLFMLLAANCNCHVFAIRLGSILLWSPVSNFGIDYYCKRWVGTFKMKLETFVFFCPESCLILSPGNHGVALSQGFKHLSIEKHPVLYDSDGDKGQKWDATWRGLFLLFMVLPFRYCQVSNICYVMKHHKIMYCSSNDRGSKVGRDVTSSGRYLPA